MDPGVFDTSPGHPFGGLPFPEAEDGYPVARTTIQQITPNHNRDHFSFRCIRIGKLMLIKVMIAGMTCHPMKPGKAEFELTNEIHCN